MEICFQEKVECWKIENFENLLLFKKNVVFVDNIFKKWKKIFKSEEIDDESENWLTNWKMVEKIGKFGII